MDRLGSVLRVRKERVDRTKFAFKDLQPLTVHLNGKVSKREVSEDREYTMDLWFAKPGDIVVAKIDLKSGAVGIVPNDWENVVVTGHFAVYEPVHERMLPDFFHLIIQAPFFKTHLWRNKVGAEGRKEVKLDFFESELIPVPPLAIQKAIVAHWQTTADRNVAALKAADEHEVKVRHTFLEKLGLNDRAQAINQRAFTLPWSLIERWGVDGLRKGVGGIDPTKGRYAAVSLGSVLELVQYGTSEKANEEQRGVPVLRIGNIKEGTIGWENLKHILLPEKTERGLRLVDGDILIIRTSGSRDLVGTCGVYRGDRPAVFASYLIRLRVEASKASSEFVNYFINSAAGRQQVDAVSRQIMQNNINSEEIKGLRLPLPPLHVQNQLVAEVMVAREQIAAERATATRLAADTAREVEEMILGQRPAPKITPN